MSTDNIAKVLLMGTHNVFVGLEEIKYQYLLVEKSALPLVQK